MCITTSRSSCTLGHLDALAPTIAAIEKVVGLGQAPVRRAAQRQRSMPGINRTTKQVLVAKIGVDMPCFTWAAHLRS